MNKELAKTLTTALVQFIDRESPEGTMCCSNVACTALEKAFVDNDFKGVEDFIQYKLSRLTEFEKCMLDFAEARDEYEFDSTKVVEINNKVIELTKSYSKKLLDIAREQLIKDGYVIEKKSFRDAVEKISPEVMKEVSDEVDEMLEKEQKPEPVFKIGDKIKLKSEPTYPYREIVDIKNGAYYFDEAVHLPFDNQNNWEKKQKPINLDLDTLVIELEETIGTSPHSRETIKEFFLKATQKYVNALRKTNKEIGELIEENFYLKEQQPAEWSDYKDKVNVPYCSSEPEWSEEDETRLTNILIMLKEYLIHHYSKDDIDKSVDWLENRVKFLRPQPKKELSIEKAIKWLDDTFYFLDNSSGRGRDCEITTHDFDSLEEMYDSFRKAVIVDSEPHWKPSEEQLEELNKVRTLNPGLDALYQQLKNM